MATVAASSGSADRGVRLRSGAGDLLALLRTGVASESFSPAADKTRMATRSGRQLVVGLVVNARRSLDRRSLDLLEATAVNCVRTGPAAQNRAGHPDFRAHLLGRLAWVAAAAPHEADRLRVVFDRIDWT